MTATLDISRTASAIVVSLDQPNRAPMVATINFNADINYPVNGIYAVQVVRWAQRVVAKLAHNMTPLGVDNDIMAAIQSGRSLRLTINSSAPIWDRVHTTKEAN
jgi:hypothetical protein